MTKSYPTGVLNLTSFRLKKEWVLILSTNVNNSAREPRIQSIGAHSTLFVVFCACFDTAMHVVEAFLGRSIEIQGSGVE